MTSIPVWLTWWSAACISGDNNLLVGAIAFRCDEGEFLLDLSTGKVETRGFGAQAWIIGNSDEFLSIAEGTSNAQSLTIQGKVSFGGEIEVLHQFASLVDRGRKAASVVSH